MVFVRWCFILFHRYFQNSHFLAFFAGWWFQPLWKIWCRQLGWLFPIYGKIKTMFKTTNQFGACQNNPGRFTTGPGRGGFLQPSGGEFPPLDAAWDACPGSTWETWTDMLNMLQRSYGIHTYCSYLYIYIYIFIELYIDEFYRVSDSEKKMTTDQLVIMWFGCKFAIFCDHLGRWALSCATFHPSAYRQSGGGRPKKWCPPAKWEKNKPHVPAETYRNLKYYQILLLHLLHQA